MHLEKEDKQHLAEQVNRWITTIRDSKTVPTVSAPSLESADWWKPEMVSPEVEEAIQGFRKSRQILDLLGEEPESGVSDNSFVLLLGVILDALPARCLQGEVSDEDRQRPIRIFLDDLFEQLAQGEVRVTVARLVFGVPVGLISSVALRDTDTKVALPLKAVVDAIGTDALQARTVRPGKRLNIAHLPELFSPAATEPATPPATINGTDQTAALPQGSEAPTAAEPMPVAAMRSAEPATRATETAAPPLPIPMAVGAQAPAAVVAVVGQLCAERIDAGTIPEAEVVVATSKTPPVSGPPVDEKPAPMAVHVSTLAMDRLNANGVDLNRADETLLCTLPGVTPAVAGAILAHRAQHGAFADVFALADVPRVGRKTFRKITGMPYSRTRRHRGAVLTRWLGLDPAVPVSLPALVRAVAASPGLAGCVMSDSEGLLLAESGAGEQAAALAAIVPRLMQQVRDNIHDLGGDGVSTVSVAYSGRLLTAVSAGDVHLTALHRANRLTTGLHQHLRRVAIELEWWFSRRGYVSAADDFPEAQDHA